MAEGGPSKGPGPTRKPLVPDVVIVGPGEDDNARFGSMLRVLRLNAQLSRADAAAMLGLSIEYLRLIEAGRRTPALGQMPRFLEAYGVEGGIEVPQPDGTVADLILFVRPDDDPMFVEFRSRVREARGGGRSRLASLEPDEASAEVDDEYAAELGAVVALLTRVEMHTLRRVRRLLEHELT